MNPSARFEQFREYIESRLTDTEFRLCEVAGKFRVSDRYVRRIFECRQETVSKYVLRRRLELSAQMLRDPRRRDATILVIALDCGFSGAAYFSRCFRHRFGTMPSAYRKTDPAQNLRLTEMPYSRGRPGCPLVAPVVVNWSKRVR